MANFRPKFVISGNNKKREAFNMLNMLLTVKLKGKGCPYMKIMTSITDLQLLFMNEISRRSSNLVFICNVQNTL